MIRNLMVASSMAKNVSHTFSFRLSSRDVWEDDDDFRSTLVGIYGKMDEFVVASAIWTSKIWDLMNIFPIAAIPFKD